MQLIFFYQIEAYIAGNWEPIPDRTYACPMGSFRQMFNLLNLAPGQRIRRVGDMSIFLEKKGWKPAFLYSSKQGILRDWPKGS